MTRHIPVLVLAGLAATAGGQQPVRVLDRSLDMSEAVLLELDEQTLVVRDESGRTRRVAVGEVAAASAGLARPSLPILPEARPSRVFVELTDGQRVVVDLAASDDPDSLAGEVLGLGTAKIPLEQVVRVVRPGAAWSAPSPSSDEVLLSNGDRLTGFVARIGPTVVVETADGSRSEIGVERVAEVRLANPVQAAPELLVTDDLGVTLRVQSVAVGPDGVLELTTPAASIGVDSRGEDALAYARPGARFAGFRSAGSAGLVAVAGLEASGVRPTGGRRWTPDPLVNPAEDPLLGIGDITLPAPAEVGFDLPPDAERFAAGVSARGGAWTDCVAQVWGEDVGGQRTLLAEHRLTADGGTAVAVDLPASVRRLVLLVEPGRYGAVQDTVVFTAPRVRVGR